MRANRLNENQRETKSVLDKFRSVTPKIKLIPQENMSLLGSPINANATERILSDKLQELIVMTTRLKELDAHDALFLLKNCFYTLVDIHPANSALLRKQSIRSL